jgi:hypothetical protein
MDRKRRILHMRITTYLTITLLPFIFAGIALAQESNPSSKGVVLLLMPVRGQATYELDGITVVKGALLNRLGDSFGKSGDKNLKILIHEDNKLSDVVGVLAIAGKVGFTDIRIYCYDRQRQGMSEITIGREQQYNKAP